MIEVCSQCFKTINTKRDAYYTGVEVRHGERAEDRYYLHPGCYEPWRANR